MAADRLRFDPRRQKPPVACPMGVRQHQVQDSSWRRPSTESMLMTEREADVYEERQRLLWDLNVVKKELEERISALQCVQHCKDCLAEDNQQLNEQLKKQEMAMADVELRWREEYSERQECTAAYEKLGTENEELKSKARQLEEALLQLQNAFQENDGKFDQIKSEKDAIEKENEALKEQLATHRPCAEPEVIEIPAIPYSPRISGSATLPEPAAEPTPRPKEGDSNEQVEFTDGNARSSSIQRTKKREPPLPTGLGVLLYELADGWL